MKAITLHQPWASAIAFGLKRYETRPRKTNHRGPIAIHAGKTFNEDGYAGVNHLPFAEHIELPLSRRWATSLTGQDFPSGAIVAVADLTDCLLMDEDLIAAQSEQELSLGHWEPGRYAYQLDDIKLLSKPVFIGGKQGLWNWEPQDGDIDT